MKRQWLGASEKKTANLEYDDCQYPRDETLPENDAEGVAVPELAADGCDGCDARRVEQAEDEHARCLQSGHDRRDRNAAVQNVESGDDAFLRHESADQ